VETALARHPYSARPLGPSWGGGSECAGGQWGNNCQTSTIIQLGSCCLESNWSPNAYAGSARGYCKRGHWVTVGGYVSPATKKWVCDEWVNLPEWRKTWGCVRGHWEKRWEIDAEGKILVNEWVCDEWGWIDMGTM